MTLEELTTPLTRQEVEANIYASLAAQGVGTTSWKPGAVARAIITAVSIVIAACTVLIAAIAKGGFLELAEGDWLTLVARYVFGVERLGGTFATATVTVQNTAGGIFSGGPDDLVFSTSDGKTFRNTEPFSIPSVLDSPDPVEIPVRAVELGSGSSVVGDEIDVLVTPLIGVVITGSTAGVGLDPEGDAALRERCREKLGTLSPNGPRDAYSYVAKSARRPDGTPIGVTRIKTIADGFGSVDVYVATAGGEVDTADITTIQDEIDTKVVPEAVTATVLNGTPAAQSITYELWVEDTSGLSDAELEANIESGLRSFFATQPIGGVRLPPASTGRLYVDAIRFAIASACPSGTFRELNLITPAADVDLGATEFATPGPVTATIHQVSTGVS